jgi:hypothetical protein
MASLYSFCVRRWELLHSIRREQQTGFSCWNADADTRTWCIRHPAHRHPDLTCGRSSLRLRTRNAWPFRCDSLWSMDLLPSTLVSYAQALPSSMWPQRNCDSHCHTDLPGTFVSEMLVLLKLGMMVPRSPPDGPALQPPLLGVWCWELGMHRFKQSTASCHFGLLVMQSLPVSWQSIVKHGVANEQSRLLSLTCL